MALVEFALKSHKCMCNAQASGWRTPLSFENLAFQDFVAKLHRAGQRWVPILDSPIHIQPGYAPYESGIAQDVFMKDLTGRPYVGQVKLASAPARVQSRIACLLPAILLLVSLPCNHVLCRCGQAQRTGLTS